MILAVIVFLNPDNSDWFLILELALVLILVAEVIGRMYLSGVRPYWKDMLNVFDVVVIVAGLVSFVFISLNVMIFHIIIGLSITLRSCMQLARLLHSIKQSKKT